MSEEVLSRINRPPAGWGEDNRGNATFVIHGRRELDYDPPKFEGRDPDWVAVFGAKYTRWTYYKRDDAEQEWKDMSGHEFVAAQRRLNTKGDPR